MKYLIVYPMYQGAMPECYLFEGTKEEAIGDATLGDRHLDYGREGVQIFEVGEPVYKITERQNEYLPSPPDQYIDSEEDFRA